MRGPTATELRARAVQTAGIDAIRRHAETQALRKKVYGSGSPAGASSAQAWAPPEASPSAEEVAADLQRAARELVEAPRTWPRPV